jgi:fructokinase
VSTDLVQVDTSLPTGFVRVTVADDGNAAYDILEPAAWDNLETTRTLLDRADAAQAVVFGTLAQRGGVTRDTLRRILDTRALKVLDVNLRPPYDDREIIRDSLRRADVVKLNEEEMQRLASWLDLRGDLQRIAAALAATFRCYTVCVTRGPHGAALLHEGRWSEHPGFEVDVRDTVGSGDAFLAVLLAGLLKGTDDEALLHHANLIGAYVATQHGAVPADQPAHEPPLAGP